MTEATGGVRAAAIRPATETTVPPADELLVEAAARILARHHHPDWRPADDDIDAWGHGYHDGHRQGYADGRADV